MAVFEVVSRLHFKQQYFVAGTKRQQPAAVFKTNGRSSLRDQHENIFPCVKFNGVPKRKIQLRFLGLIYFCIIKRQFRTVLSSLLVIITFSLIISMVFAITTPLLML